MKFHQCGTQLLPKPPSQQDDRLSLIKNIGIFETALLLATLALLTIGLVTLERIGLPIENGLDSQVARQMLFAVVGLFGMIFMACINYRTWSVLAWTAYLLALIMLVAVLFIGVTRFGSQRWFLLGAFQFQPSEFAKLAMIFMLARYFSRRPNRRTDLSTLFGSMLIVAPPVLLILLEPDLGTSLILVTIWFGMTFLSGAAIRHIIIMISIALLSLPIAWLIMKPYMRDRIVTFIDPTVDPLGAGYNVLQARIAVGSGGWFGRGVSEATQSQLEFLRVRDTDFIFAVIAEHLGFIGAITVIILFAIVITYSLIAALRATDNFGRLTAGGLLIMLTFEVVISIGMNIGVAPITGITLPLLSAGGSSLVMTMAGIGLLLSISLHKGDSLFDRPTRVSLPASSKPYSDAYKEYPE